MNPNFKTIGEMCANKYYEFYDAGDLDNLTNLYHESALLTFEGEQLQGREAIRKKHSNLVGKTCHLITTVDSQPTFEDNGITVTVVGQVKTEGEEKALGFLQSLIIRPYLNQFYIFNEMFRLSLHNM